MAPGMIPACRPTRAAGAILTGVLLLILSCGCIAPDPEPGNPTAPPALTATPATATAVPDTIRVVKFQPTRACYSCTLLGNYAKETIEVYFPAEYAAGTLQYHTVNYQDPKNSELVRKYGVIGSELFITVIRNGNEEIHNANEMWAYIGNKEEYMAVFKARLDALLRGDEDV